MALTMRRTITAALWLLGATLLPGQKTPDEALRALQEGNRRFAADRSVPQPVGEGVRRTLARGQSPFAIVLCCADSRVPPEHVFNCGLGELFVVRVAGHACDPETLASIEYAVDHLNVPLCVVLGHESCGAVGAAVAQVQSEGNQHAEAAPSQAIQQLLEHIQPAVRKVQPRDLGGKELTNACEEEHAQLTVQECLRRSPMLKRYAQVGRFKMVAARYHLQSGEVEWLPLRPLPADPDANPQQALHHAAPMTTPPHVALRMLQAGHRRFLGDGPQAGDLGQARREQLTHGQHPLAIVLTCADSRVAPEHVFDAGLGELFVIRVAGNTLNDDTLASIEYAATHTGASLLVVMGHSKCGAVGAAAEHPAGQQLSSPMRSLLARLEPAVDAARRQGGKGPELVELAVRANVQRVALEARSRSAILRHLEHEGRFAILPTVYDIASGDLTWLKEAAEQAPAAAPTGETRPAHGAAPAAAPTTDGHGAAPSGHGDGHGNAADHANHGAAPATGHGEGDSHGDTHPAKANHGLPVLDWGDAPPPAPAATHGGGDDHPPAAPHGETANHGEHGDASHAAHGAQAGHGAAATHDGHAAHEEHGDHGGHGEHEGHGEHAEPAHTGQSERSQWADPIVVVGLSGIASLLLAALVAVLKK